MGIAENFRKRQSQQQSQVVPKVGDEVQVIDDTDDEYYGEFGDIESISSDPNTNEPIYRVEFSEKDENYFTGDAIEVVPTTTQTQPKVTTKEDLSARIYDITQSQQPEAYEGELQELMNQWQQVTGTPQPRFLGGSNSSS